MPRKAIGRGVCGGCLEVRKLNQNPRGPIAECRQCLKEGMTIDRLIEKLNNGYGQVQFEVSLRGDGKWTAAIAGVTILNQKGNEIEQLNPKTFVPRNAVAQLVEWLRGKRICLRGTNGGADGVAIKVPKNLKIPLIR